MEKRDSQPRPSPLPQTASGTERPCLLSLGHGYVARVLTPHLLRQGWRVIGTTRDAARAAQMRSEGVEPLLLPQDIEPALAAATHILHSASPAAQGDPFLPLAPKIAATPPRWFGYLSTTGVYGDTGGAWVDETSPLAPARGRSQDRAEAEAAWLETGLPVHIFRLSGIYGPGRGPFEKLRAGSAKRIVKQGQVFSRIHVEDICQVLMGSIRHPNPRQIYNLADDLPCPADEVLLYAAALLGLPAPDAVEFETADLTPMARSFYAECRRVRNEKIKRDLGIALLYPSYREGLAAILAAESS